MDRKWIEQQFCGPESTPFGLGTFKMTHLDIPWSLMIFLNGSFMMEGLDYKIDRSEPLPKVVFVQKWNLHHEDAIVIRYEVVV